MRRRPLRPFRGEGRGSFAGCRAGTKAWGMPIPPIGAPAQDQSSMNSSYWSWFMSCSSSSGSVISTSMNHPFPYGSTLIREGSSTTFSLPARMVPDRGETSSTTVFWDSSSPIASPWPMVLPFLPQNGEGGLHAAQGGAYLEPAHAGRDPLDGPPRDVDPGPAALLLGPAAGHVVEDLPGNDHPGDLVVHELGVLVADQRPHSRDDGDATCGSLHAVQETEEGLHVEDRLGDGELGARVDLAEVPVDFPRKFHGARVHAHSDEDARGRVDRVPADVEPPVQVGRHLGKDRK